MIDAAPYIARYQKGEWRTPIFHDMIMEDLERMGGRPLTVLDIGCGHGFDLETKHQKSIADRAARYIGVEPDPDIAMDACFSETHRCVLEKAPIKPNSVDLAFAVMVLEHVSEPDQFWGKLHSVLAEGGVFWGFTVDSRHWFRNASLLAENLHLKEFYLRRLMGTRGTERYENYPAFYRANSPEQIRAHTKNFHSSEFINLSRVGQVDDYLPRILRPVSRYVDGVSIRRNWPGINLVVRLQK